MGTRLYMRIAGATEPMPNAKITGDVATFGTYRAAKDGTEAVGSSRTRLDQNITWNDSFTTVYTNVCQMISYPLAAMTLSAQDYTAHLFSNVTVASANVSTAKIRTGVYLWDGQTDTLKKTISPQITNGNNLLTLSAPYDNVHTTAGTSNVADGDRLVLEINYEIFNGEGLFQVLPSICRLNFDSATLAPSYLELSTDTLVEYSGFNYAPHAGL